jgi:hypothetical protein
MPTMIFKNMEIGIRLNPVSAERSDWIDSNSLYWMLSKQPSISDWWEPRHF